MGGVVSFPFGVALSEQELNEGFGAFSSLLPILPKLEGLGGCVSSKPAIELV